MITEETKNYYKKVREITNGTYNKVVGMYIGEQNNPSCKQNRNILVTMVPTSNFNDTITIQRGFYQRNYLKHKKGDPKTVKVLRKVPAPTTPNIQAAWQMVFDYPTVSYGLSFFRRDVIVIDSDAYYESLEKAKEIISNFTNKAQLPEVSYILRNPSSGHIQCGWFIDKPFEKYEFNKYNEATKMFASMYQEATGNDGDICFNGPACKNPFYEGFESYVSFNVASKQLMLEKSDSWFIYLSRKSTNYNINNSLFSPLYNITKVTVKDKVTTMTKSGRNKITKSVFGSEETSRDAIECRKLREWVWSEMRRGSTPTYQDARQMMNMFAVEAAKMTNKPVHSDAELTATTKCTYTWAKTHFNRTNTSTGDRAGAAWGRLVHKMQSFVIYAEVLKYKAEHPTASTRDIGNVVGLSNKQVSVMLRADVNVKLNEVKHFMQYVNQFPKYASQYSMLVSSLLSAKKDVLLYINNSLLSPLYNITKVTVDNESKQIDIKTTETTTTTTKTTDKQAEETFNLTKHCAIKENHYKTWDEFCQSNIVCNQLRRRPRPKDWINYTKGLLTIREDAYAI